MKDTGEQKNFAGIYRNPIANLKGAMRTVFKELLLTVNFADNPDFLFDGKPYPLRRGQLVTSRRELVINTGLTEQQVRTALKNLEKLKYLTNLSTNQLTNRATLITIVNIDDYLVCNDKLTNQLTNQLTTNNKDSTNNISKDIEPEVPKIKNFGDNKINLFIKALNGRLTKKLSDYDRKLISSIVKLCEKYDTKGKVKKDREWLKDRWEDNARDFLEWYKEEKIDKGYLPQNTHKVFENFKYWFNNEGLAQSESRYVLV